MKILDTDTKNYPRQLPGPCMTAGRSIVFVLVDDDIGHCACFAGHGEPEWVARFGDKLVFEEARIHFPTIARNKYRD